MAFKRFGGIVGLSGPPGQDPEKRQDPYLAYLLMTLLFEPHTSAPHISLGRFDGAGSVAADLSCRQGTAGGDHACTDAAASERAHPQVPPD